MFADLDFGRLAVGFGLLTLPKMPELKKKNTDFFQPADVDLNAIAYKDKTREKIRQEKLVVYRETGVWPTSKANAAPAKKKESWSEKKAQRTHKKEKKQIKLEQKEKRKKKSIDQDDWDEMAREARLLKKFKKRKVLPHFLFIKLHEYSHDSNWKFQRCLATFSFFSALKTNNQVRTLIKSTRHTLYYSLQKSI